jgi:putative peptidoglycan lipid II flippase
MTYIDIALASLLSEGSLSALEYATRLSLLPISLFGMSAAASELPELSALDADDRELAARRLAPTLARIAFYVVPTMVGFVVLGDLLYGLVLAPLPSRLVWFVLIGSTVGLLSNTSSRLLQSALYAAGDTRAPATFAIMRVVLAAALGALLMLQFDRVVLSQSGFALQGSLPAFTPLPPAERATDPDTAMRLGAVGLALAAGMSSWLEFALLRRHLLRRRGLRARVGGGALLRTIAPGIAAGAVAIGVRLLVADVPLIWQVLIVGSAIVVVYLALASVAGLPEMRQVRRILRGRHRP